jgi:acetyltransferase-like isoleucine patch superfamily enzyme
VFVGANSVILGPITIGDHCIIGAGTVVTSSVPTGSVVRGAGAVIEPCRRDTMDAERWPQTL